MDEIETEVEKTEQPEQEMVEIHEASSEDLQAFLKNSNEQETRSESEEEEDTLEVEESPAVQEAHQKPNQTESQRAPQQADDAQGLREENERLKTQGQQKELFIQRRNTELGDVRKELSTTKQELVEARNALVQGLNDKYQEDPSEALEDRDTIKRLDADIRAVDGKSELLETTYSNERLFLQHIDTSKVKLEDMTEVLSADGVPSEYIEAFKKNPYSFTSGENLIMIAKRAEERKQLKTVAKYALGLMEENKKLKSTRGNLLSNVQRNLNSSPPLTAAASGKSGGGKKIHKDPTEMSRAELADYLATAS